MQKESEKFQDSGIFEGMTSIRAVLRATLIDHNPTNDRVIQKILYNCEKLTPADDKNLRYLTRMAEKLDFPLEGVSSQTIDDMTLGHSHGGIIAVCSKRTIPALRVEDIAPGGFYCMIQGVEDPYNFGYALRSLYASGVAGVILPERNWMTAAGVVARASAGASELLPVYTADPTGCVSLFHLAHYLVVCADLRTEHVLFQSDLRLPLLLLIGGERRGISRELLDMTDLRVKISYARDFGASLSTASAATIFSYEIFRQNAILHAGQDSPLS